MQSADETHIDETRVKNMFENAVEYDKKIIADPQGRWKSWDVCYQEFQYALSSQDRSPAVIDHLALHLGFYLASWGMYRGSAFALNKNHEIHRGAVEILLRPEWQELNNVTYEAISGEDKIRSTIIELGSNLRNHYRTIADELDRSPGLLKEQTQDQARVKTYNITQTLITKIMLSTLACAPAYDRNLTAGIALINKIERTKIPTTFNSESLRKATTYFIEKLNKQPDTIRSYFQTGKVPAPGHAINYPDMKNLDFVIWCLGANVISNP